MPSHLGTIVLLAVLAAAAAAEAEGPVGGVSMLQHSRATKSCISKHEDDLEAVGATYRQVDQLMNRHHELSERMSGTEHNGWELKEAHRLHESLGKSIQKIRQDSESLLELAARKGGSCELRSAVHGLERPVGDLSKGLDKLSLLQQRAAEKTALEELAQHPDSDLAAVAGTYQRVGQLVDRYHLLSARAHAGDQQGREARKLHKSLGKSIRSIRKKTEALLQVRASNKKPGKLRTALKQLRRPMALLQAGLHKLAKHQEATDKRALARLAGDQNDDVAAVGAALQRVDGLVDRYHKVSRKGTDDALGGEKLREARELHEAVGGAIGKMRRGAESLLQLASKGGESRSALRSQLQGLQRPMQDLQAGLGRLEQLQA